jgi:hypothetical protein
MALDSLEEPGGVRAQLALDRELRAASERIGHLIGELLGSDRSQLPLDVAELLAWLQPARSRRGQSLGVELRASAARRASSAGVATNSRKSPPPSARARTVNAAALLSQAKLVDYHRVSGDTISIPTRSL